MPIVISVEHLSKAYHLGQIGTGTFSRDLELWWAKLRGKPNPFLRIGEKDHGNRDGEELWALRDVSFKVEQGEVLGIIGRNGAGKSTLLKILSRVTAPTSGKIKVKGRVASLLEVGTGFHPELTGRENIYLNGAILGMSKQEVARKFNEIVDFAEVERFIDTPVKRYSSGMYVRLAFAVAAHLEPEILVVDEVLAVGDAAFQKKCLGKMGDVARQGRTVLFVSHNMAALRHLCKKSIFLEAGCIKQLDDTEQIIRNYLYKPISYDTNLDDFRPNWAQKYIKNVRILDSVLSPTDSILLGDTFVTEIDFSSNGRRFFKKPVMGIVVNSNSSGIVGGVNTRMTGFEINSGPFSQGKIRCRLSNLPLIQGEYLIDVWFGDGQEDLDALIGCRKILVREADIYNTGKSPFGNLGVIFLKPEWEFLGDK